jgi:hypothetical protein
MFFVIIHVIIDHIVKMTYRKVYVENIHERLYECGGILEQYDWIFCYCCSSRFIKDKDKVNLPRICYDCVCCRKKYPFLKDIKISNNWQWLCIAPNDFEYVEIESNDIYESVDDPQKFIFVCDYMSAREISYNEISYNENSFNKLYKETEICDMAARIYYVDKINKTGKEYIHRHEKHKVYWLALQVQMTKKKTKISANMSSIFHTREMVENIVRFMWMKLSIF